MRVISFADYTPSPRYDNQPWTGLKIYEAAAKDTPDDAWTLIDTQQLQPVDTNPADPQSRNFTTENASDQADLWYRIVFFDATGEETLPTAPIQNTEEITQAYLPTVQDVADLLHARTVDEFSNELGTFNDKTRPTGMEVQGIIQIAAADVTAEVDTDIPVAAWDAAQKCIAIRAAMLVELSYFPQHVGTASSPYEQYKELYDQMLARLDRAVQREAEEELYGETPEVGAPFMTFQPWPPTQPLLPIESEAWVDWAKVAW